MGGGSKKTTNVTNTGLGDSQYKNLQAGQNNLGKQITNVDTNATKRFDSADKSLAGLASGQTSLGNQITASQNATASGISGLGTQIGGVGDQVTGVSNQITGLGSEMGNQFGTLNTNMNNAFADQTSTINANVDNRFGTLTEGMNNQFENTNQNMATGFTNTANTINTAAQGINTNLADARADINQNVSSGFEATQNQLTDTEAAVLSGQSGLGDQLTQVGGNLDTYYSGLAAQNAEQLAAQGQLQTGLDSYIGQYDRDNKLAVQQRADLVEGVTSGFDNVNDNMASQNDAATSERMALAQQVTGVNEAVGTAQQNTESKFSDVAKQIAVGFDDGTQESANMRNDFINRLNTVRQVLTTQGDQLDANVRDQYAKMSDSFDDTGELISRSVDQQGNTVGRALDAQGNLLMATFDQYGGRINQQSLNLDQMMGQLDQLGYVPTSGAGGGPLSPQVLATRPAAVTSGLASPFTSTR